MKISLKNIGKIKEANVEINGITVIAGENDTGKSTVGKALFCFFNGLYDIKQRMIKEKIYSIEKIINENEICWIRYDEIEEQILAIKERDGIDREKLTDTIRQFLYSFEFLDKSNLESRIARICDIVMIPEEIIMKTMITKFLEIEFNEQINHLFFDEPSEMKLMIGKKYIKITILENKVVKMEGEEQLNTEAIYIDDPFILDNILNKKPRVQLVSMSRNKYYDHKKHLKEKIFLDNHNMSVIDSILIEKGLEEVRKKIELVCNGEIVSDKKGQLVYVKNGKQLSINNLSTGLKSFTMLKILLENGTIKRNGTIILDEPEIHLHPEWQLIFAEVIVLLQKQFDLHILLNTHSPYFLKAIETYTAKHEIADKCKYYLTSVEEESSILEDVTTYTEKIYQKLAIPLETLKREQYGYD